MQVNLVVYLCFFDSNGKLYLYSKTSSSFICIASSIKKVYYTNCERRYGGSELLFPFSKRNAGCLFLFRSIQKYWKNRTNPPSLINMFMTLFLLNLMKKEILNVALKRHLLTEIKSSTLNEWKIDANIKT